MLRKYLNEGFVVTPPEHSTLVPSNLGTVCHVEEIVSVSPDGSYVMIVVVVVVVVVVIVVVDYYYYYYYYYE